MEDIRYCGGRGASGGDGFADGPSGPGKGNSDPNYGQLNTPQVPPAPTIAGQIGKKGNPISSIRAIKEVNPDRDSAYADYSENCQRCVVAYELNRRGYRVEAEATYQNDPMPYNHNWAKAFGVKNSDFINVGSTTTSGSNKKILKEMSAWGDGSRAVVSVAYPGGNNGHVFNVEYKGGSLHYYDAQTGVRYDTSKVFNHVSRARTEIVRVDNRKITDDVRQMVRKKQTHIYYENKK